uniref:Reelin domain-containing protein n=1 Tax=Panagrolaimus davidi TaxID=227884 RepID=A0A914QWQ0_9BILA
MKSFLVLFAIFSLCFALPLESEDADKPTTTEEPEKPTGATAPGDTYSDSDTLNEKKRTHSYQLPTHINRGVYFSLSTTNSSTKGIGTLFVSLKPNPNANDYSFYTTASASPKTIGELSLSSADLIKAGVDKDKNETTTYITIEAASDEFSYTITWKPLDAPTTTTTTTTPTTPTTSTTSSSVMVSPTFLNSLLLIALYNFFTFSK